MAGSEPPGASVVAYAALGSNLGTRLEHLQGAVDHLARSPSVLVRRVSPVYETQALTPEGAGAQPPYLNAVVELLTERSAADLLDMFLAIERAGGRERRERWGARTIDLDLLIYGDLRVTAPGLEVPHPRMAERRFVLQPLADLAPQLVVPPPINASVYSLLERTPDRGDARRYPMELTIPQHGFFGGRGGNDV